MNEELRFLFSYLGRTVLFAVVVTLPIGLLYLDIYWLKDAVGEWSLVELTQLGLLLASVSAFVRRARQQPEERAFALLAAGLFACMLIRELDAAWDLLFDGCWQLLVSALAVGSLLYAARDRRRTLTALVRFLGAVASSVEDKRLDVV
jgi:hypothetical protein